MCHRTPFSDRAMKKNIFFDVNIVEKTVLTHVSMIPLLKKYLTLLRNHASDDKLKLGLPILEKNNRSKTAC